jgi:DNA-binding SARP family transcriptional activator
MRSLRAALALLLLLVLVTGIPLLLTATIGNPASGWADLWVGDVSDRAIIAVLATLTWLAWAQFAGALVREGLALARHAPAPDLTGWAAGPQQVARALLTAVFLALPVAGPAAAGVGLPRAPVAMVAPVAPVAISPPGLPTAPTITYQVVDGDWLGGIAERFLGTFGRYPQIVRTNPGLFTGDRPASDRRPVGDHIEPGWTLTLPAGVRDRGPGRHASGTPAVDLTSPQGSAKHPDAPRERPGASSPAAPPESAQESASPLEPVTPAPSAHATGGPGPAVVPALRRTAGDERGVAVPGGWVSLPLAAAIVAAAALTWRRRRHRYRYPADIADVPDTDDSDDDDDSDPRAEPVRGADRVRDLDADLRPLPAVVHRLRRAVRAHAAAIEAEAAYVPTHMPFQIPGTRPVTTEVRVDPPHRPGSTGPEFADADHLVWPPDAGLDAIPTGGLGLLGPGASAAARAFLVAALAPDPPSDPHAPARVITTTATMDELFPALAPVGPLPPQRDVDGRTSAAAAVAALEETLLERSRRRDGDRDLHQQRSAAPPSAPAPLLVLISAPPPEVWARLSADLGLGAALHVRGVIVGAWQPGHTVTVDADGVATGQDTHRARWGRRLAVLDEPTAIDLLGVVLEAHAAASARPALDAPGTAAALAPAALTPDARAADLRLISTAVLAPPPHEEDPRADVASPLVRPVPGSPQEISPPEGFGPTGGPVVVTLFGTPTIWDPHGTPMPRLRQHARELLVYLTVHRSGARLSEIMEALWPDATVRRASARLSTEVANLRRTIRLSAGDMDLQPVINTGGRYHLAPAILDIDVWRLQDNLAQARDTVDETSRALSLRAAVAAYTGLLAEPEDFDWIHVHREQLRREAIRAHLTLAAHPSTSPTDAAILLEDAADLDPLSEDVARRAIRALCALGDSEKANRRLRSLQAGLKDIGEAPSEATRRLLE